MVEMQRPMFVVEELHEDGKYGRFSVKPLERGFGNTLGNGIRRVLLSSLRGVAPTSIKIDNVLHEFSTVEGVREDVTEIVLNVKSIVANIFSEETRTAVIDKKGPCEITAGMIEPDSGIDIVNKNLHIASVNKDGHLRMEINFKNGKGYISAEQNKLAIFGGKSELGIIFVDSIYTPVIRANYSVENTRVGQITDYDKLTLEVWTNGLLTAEEAVLDASEILINYLKIFSIQESSVNADSDIPEEVFNNSSTDVTAEAKIKTKENFEQFEQEEVTKENVFDLENARIENLELSVRSYNCLKRAGVSFVKELINMTEDDMQKVRNLGKKSFDEVLGKLESLGLKLRQASFEEITSIT